MIINNTKQVNGIFKNLFILYYNFIFTYNFHYMTSCMYKKKNSED